MGLTADQIISGARPPRYIAKIFQRQNGEFISSQFRYISAWAYPGQPGPGTYDTTLNGVTLTSNSTSLLNGAAYIEDAPPGQFNYIAKISGLALQSVGVSSAILYMDRVWHNGGINVISTSAQSITTPTFPPRDNDGNTNGVGYHIALEVISSVMGSGSPSFSVSYTNSDGVPGRTASNINSISGAAPLGSMVFFGLQGNDAGVRSIESITLSASWTSGSLGLLVYRPILFSSTSIHAYNTPGDPISILTPKIYNGTVLSFAAIKGTANTEPGVGVYYTVTRG